MRNDICTTIFQQFFDNFISHIHIIFLFSLSSFFSLLFLTNQKRKNLSCHESCTKKVVQISLYYEENDNKEYYHPFMRTLLHHTNISMIYFMITMNFSTYKYAVTSGNHQDLLAFLHQSVIIS